LFAAAADYKGQVLRRASARVHSRLPIVLENLGIAGGRLTDYGNRRNPGTRSHAALGRPIQPVCAGGKESAYLNHILHDWHAALGQTCIRNAVTLGPECGNQAVGGEIPKDNLAVWSVGWAVPNLQIDFNNRGGRWELIRAVLIGKQGYRVYLPTTRIRDDEIIGGVIP